MKLEDYVQGKYAVACDDKKDVNAIIDVVEVFGEFTPRLALKHVAEGAINLMTFRTFFDNYFVFETLVDAEAYAAKAAKDDEGDDE